jgi:hypothetical protein
MYSQPNLLGPDQEKLATIQKWLSQKFPHVTWKVEKAYSPTAGESLPIESCVVLSHSSNFSASDKLQLFECYVGKIPEFVLQDL